MAPSSFRNPVGKLHVLQLVAMLHWDVWRSKNDLIRAQFNFPFRAVVATDFRNLRQQGYFSIPWFGFIVAPNKYTMNWSIDISWALMYGSNKYHDYFYSVAPEHATANRPVYEARRGYSGADFEIVCC